MMIQKYLPLIFLLFFFSLYSQTIIKKSIDSGYLGYSREIKIYLPEGYDKDEEKNYPLAIVFDAEYLFDLYVGNAVLFATKDKAPKQIIIGINMAKTRKKDTYFNMDNGTLTKNNANFYNFIRDEVIFEIESSYNTSPFITLIGEGTSANLITAFLGEQTPIINAYICINPTFSDFIASQMQAYKLARFQKEDNTFYFYTNNSNIFSNRKQTLILLFQIL